MVRGQDIMGRQDHGESEAEPRVLRGLRLAFSLSVLILAAEVIGAYFSRSLSLTVDAVHNVPDLVAFGASWGALAGIQSGASRHYTFGSHRFEVFAGLFNAALVLSVGLGFGYEAIQVLRTQSPFAGAVGAVWVLAVAAPVLGLRGANLVALRRIPGRARDLNLHSVLVHLSSDLVITGALVFVGLALLVRPGWWWADPSAAFVIGAVLVWESLPLFRAGWDVLTERTPSNLSLEEIASAARGVASVTEVHDVHVWSVCPTLVCMTAHVTVSDMSVSESMAVVANLRELMERRFGILHSVFELETAPRG